ncbi:unnamed protein product [Rhizoctonia solani]|nr:unnamed protein product [Rhizoctonia solani]
MDSGYYRSRAAVIHSKGISGTLPGDHVLRPFLQDFGTICDLRKFFIKDGASVGGPSNTAIAIFYSRGPVEKILKSSKTETDASFWRIHSVTAHSIRKNEHIDQLFLTKVFPKLTLKLNGEPSGSNGLLRPDGRKLLHSSSEDHTRPAKRPRIETRERISNDTTLTSSHSLIPNTSQAASGTPDSPEWMRARIAQLETELESAKAARDMAVSEQQVLQTAHLAEQGARREAMTQKSAAEATLSRNKVEQDRLHSDLEQALAQKSALFNDVNDLRGQLAAAEEKLRLANSSLDQSSHRSERIKTLELESEAAQDQIHKLQLKLRLHDTNSDPNKPDDTGGKIKELKSKVKQLKFDLARTHEQLGSTQKSLESMERKYSSSRRKYENTKAKLGTYKARLENEQTLLIKLKDTLTPAAYQSLGATHETLGAFLSAIGLPSVDEQENAGAKEESD